jgi:hypothetical protein
MTQQVVLLVFLGFMCIVATVLAIWIGTGRRRDAEAYRREHQHEDEANKRHRID